jgi:pantoate--beta-alanine ligase
MGALHTGHDALIRAAIHARDQGNTVNGVTVSIFVNPAQFEEQHDFDNYPNTFEADADRCRALDVDCVFAPNVDTVYPDKSLLTEPITLPEACTGKNLEDAYRPGHFEGVHRVLTQLFTIARPRYATFGEKDWQQLILADHVAAELNAKDPTLKLAIIPVETQRETQGPLAGLALSSRNVHLTPNDHHAATALSRAITHAQQSFAHHNDILQAEREARDVITRSGARLEYLDIRDATTCGPPTDPQHALILTAARVGSTRLIDNDALVPA